MGEFTWLIITGLGFDIAGVVLIIRPWAYFEKWDSNKFLRNIFEEQRDENAEIQFRNKHRIKMLIGFGFLAFGFLLQIFGNWLQSPPF